MKKILIIFLFLIGCRKIEVIPTPTPVSDIFSEQSASVTYGQDIQFKLDSAGKYSLVLFDSTIQQVVSKEKFNGIAGNNIKKIYTNSFQQKNLYLLLNTENNLTIKKTLISIK